jgi:hypothetical protein
VLFSLLLISEISRIYYSKSLAMGLIVMFATLPLKDEGETAPAFG